MRTTAPIRNRPGLDPALLLLPLILSNFLLSLWGLPAPGAWVVGAVGIVWPLTWWMRWVGRAVPDRGRSVPIPGPVFWFLLVAGALVLRFARLESLTVWPLYDEGIFGWHALRLMEGEKLKWLYSKSQTPALYVAGLALLQKILGVSLITLWLWPAILSTGAVLFAHAAARRLLEPALLAPFTVFMALGFWPVFTGRFGFAVILVLFAACAGFWVLSRAIEEARNGNGFRWVLILGAVLGIGFHTYHPWPFWVVAVAAATPAWAGAGSRRAARITGAVVPMLIGLLPLILGQATEAWGHYPTRLLAPLSGISWKEWLPTGLANVQAILWGLPSTVHSYQPVWGGFLDPLTGALALLGLSWVLANLETPVHRWIVFVLILFLLPGILSLGWMPFRLVLVAPLAAYLAARGFRCLTENRSRKFQAVALPVLACLVFGSTAIHLFIGYGGTWKNKKTWAEQAKSIERSRAYRLLSGLAKTEGPGLVWTEWVPGQSDETLFYASYRFNAARNPRLDPSAARWAAVMANANYRPFLSRRFPGLVGHPLSKELGRPDGGWMLFVMPSASLNAGDRDAWIAAQKSLESGIEQNLEYIPRGPYERVLGVFLAAEPAHSRDPFLRAVYWEKIADLYEKVPAYDPESLSKAAPPGWSGKQDPALYCLGKAIEEGYPAAHLYRRMGVLHLMKGRVDEARQAFRKAIQAPLDLTDARVLSGNLDKR